MIHLDQNHVVLRSHANGLYVCADNKGESPLIANKMMAYAWETFELAPNEEGYSLKSMANGKFVCAD